MSGNTANRPNASVPTTPTNRPGPSRTPIPSPESMTMEWAMSHRGKVVRLLSQVEVPTSKVTQNTMYPVVAGQKGATFANAFLKGLEHLGLGRVVDRKFKRYNPDDEDCPDRAGVMAKWARLEFDGVN